MNYHINESTLFKYIDANNKIVDEQLSDEENADQLHEMIYDFYNADECECFLESKAVFLKIVHLFHIMNVELHSINKSILDSNKFIIELLYKSYRKHFSSIIEKITLNGFHKAYDRIQNNKLIDTIVFLKRTILEYNNVIDLTNIENIDTLTIHFSDGIKEEIINAGDLTIDYFITDLGISMQVFKEFLPQIVIGIDENYKIQNAIYSGLFFGFKKTRDSIQELLESEEKYLEINWSKVKKDKKETKQQSKSENGLDHDNELKEIDIQKSQNPIKSFQIFDESLENRERIRNIIKQLVIDVEINLLKEEADMENLLEILFSKDFSNHDQKIQINCQTRTFSYFIERLRPLFKNLDPSSIARSNIFFSKKNNPITRGNLYNSKLENPKIRDLIDRIFKNNKEKH